MRKIKLFVMRILMLCLLAGIVVYPGKRTELRAEPISKMGSFRVESPISAVVAQVLPSQPSTPTPTPSQPPTTLEPPTSTPVQPTQRSRHRNLLLPFSLNLYLLLHPRPRSRPPVLQVDRILQQDALCLNHQLCQHLNPRLHQHNPPLLLLSLSLLL